jgi:tetratricopeptide (TPR) repeat protein
MAIALALLSAPTAAGKLNLPPEAMEGQRLLYSGDYDAAVATFRRLQIAHAADPAGYLLEANALWWKFYCSACEIRSNTIDAWKRGKIPEDDTFFSLTQRAIKLAEASLKLRETPEMRFYAGMGLALDARLYGLRDEKRAAARAGVRAREHLLRAVTLDPDLADAYTGLGFYNYYVDTLSTLARILRFFMGIPGGSKQEGVRQLELAMSRGEITAVEARVQLARALHRHDRDYARALLLLEPLAAEYPRNPVFHLLRGNLLAKLGRNTQAAASYREAERLPLADGACTARIRRVAQQALAALPAEAKATGTTE